MRTRSRFIGALSALAIGPVAGSGRASVRMMSTRTVIDRSQQTITISHDTSICERADGSVVVLHGLGDTAQGWSDVARMWADAMPRVRFVLPTAPMRPVTLNGGMSMPAWYDIKALNGEADRQSCEWIGESKATIDGIVADEAAKVGGAGKVVLVGFSQGGALSLYAGLQRDDPLAGVVSMSGYLPARGAWKVAEASRAVPVAFFHGDADGVVRPDWASKSVAELKAQALESVSLKMFAGMAHSANLEEIEDVAQFIRNALAGDAVGSSKL
jgi:predicted esterase